MNKTAALLIGVTALGGIIYQLGKPTELLTPIAPHIPQPVFAIRSVDTMKYSRDLARVKSKDETFDGEIDRQVKAIADTGATHVAIATPYDEEFVPFLTRWVVTARKYGLHVWFRGNFAGWEGWFDYSRISREEHINKMDTFIRSHSTLFEDGDILTPCPECENGGSGDPRNTGDVEGFRRFLIEERKVSKQAFDAIAKAVSVDVQSMNYDVANLVMDKQTTSELGGIVGIDHYVRDPHQIAVDVAAIAAKSGGKVYLAEYGAPIPDLHGQMTESEQAEWLRASLQDLSNLKVLAGINYWVAVGGSTELWDNTGQAKEGVSVLTRYYTMLK